MNYSDNSSDSDSDYDGEYMVLDALGDGYEFEGIYEKSHL